MPSSQNPTCHPTSPRNYPTTPHAASRRFHAASPPLQAYALNEWDSKHSAGIEWRQKIDQQRGAVLATELKNNSCKLAKWTCQSMIAGADQMKIGYVSRKGRTDPHHHQILATQVG